jgi:hypothetical protein
MTTKLADSQGSTHMSEHIRHEATSNIIDNVARGQPTTVITRLAHAWARDLTLEEAAKEVGVHVDVADAVYTLCNRFDEGSADATIVAVIKWSSNR